MCQGEVQGQPAAHRTTHQHQWLVDPEMGEQGDQVAHVAERSLDGLALPVAAHVVAQHVEGVCEASELVVPLAAVGDAGVDHDERPPLASRLVVEPGTPDRGKARYGCIRWHHGSPLRVKGLSTICY